MSLRPPDSFASSPSPHDTSPSQSNANTIDLARPAIALGISTMFSTACLAACPLSPGPPPPEGLATAAPQGAAARRAEDLEWQWAWEDDELWPAAAADWRGQACGGKPAAALASSGRRDRGSVAGDDSDALGDGASLEPACACPAEGDAVAKRRCWRWAWEDGELGPAGKAACWGGPGRWPEL